jgi:hypothetical protein
MATDQKLPDEPGWYEDPDGQYSHEACWDGEKWTGATRPNQSETNIRRDARRRSNRKLILTIVGGVFITSLLVVIAGCVTDISCTYDFTYLPALKADPMANPEIPGSELVDSDNHREGWVMGKPTHAEVHLRYEIDDGYQIDDVFRDAVALAKSHGWDMEPYEPGLSFLRGTKALPTGRASIGIAAPGLRQGGFDPSRSLIITITNLASS